jgi:hypothetical protein
MQRRIRRAGTEYRRIIEDWNAVLDGDLERASRPGRPGA